MFWLAVLGGSLLLLHVLLLLILKFRKTKTEKQKIYGALVLPRFEIFLIILALPCVCEASAALLKGIHKSIFVPLVLMVTLYNTTNSLKVISALKKLVKNKMPYKTSSALSVELRQLFLSCFCCLI